VAFAMILNNISSNFIRGNFNKQNSKTSNNEKKSFKKNEA
tara:strand:- start:298 stop:417 length:120 start_codon:yes stop_codon:yes gene_type:complete